MFFPRHLVRAEAESLFNYLEKKYGLEIKIKSYQNLENIEKEVIRLLRELDSINYN